MQCIYILAGDYQWHIIIRLSALNWPFKMLTHSCSVILIFWSTATVQKPIWYWNNVGLVSFKKANSFYWKEYYFLRNVRLLFTYHRSLLSGSLLYPLGSRPIMTAAQLPRDWWTWHANNKTSVQPKWLWTKATDLQGAVVNFFTIANYYPEIGSFWSRKLTAVRCFWNDSKELWEVGLGTGTSVLSARMFHASNLSLFFSNFGKFSPSFGTASTIISIQDVGVITSVRNSFSPPHDSNACG